MVDVKENFFIEPSGTEKSEVVEPWRCGSCKALMYNVVWEDGKSYPAPGAPPATFGSKEFPRLCLMCDGIREAAGKNQYFWGLHTQAIEETNRLRRSG